MFARSSPPYNRRDMAAMGPAPPRLDPTLLREAVKKVDKCMVRLQELQYTLAGGTCRLSPTTTTTTPTFFRTKQESIKIKNGNSRRISPSDKLPTNTNTTDEAEWRGMSPLPAMISGETVGEIVEASTDQFPRRNIENPTTPKMVRRNLKEITTEHIGQLHAKRKTEKQVQVQQATRSSTSSTSFQRAKSRIDHMKKKEFEPEKNSSRRFAASRVSPRNRPWARKAVLFPNPLFQYFSSSPPPVPPPSSSANKSGAAAKLRRSFSPSNLRRSFSPSRVAIRLVSPLKGRRSVQKKVSQNVMFR